MCAGLDPSSHLIVEAAGRRTGTHVRYLDTLKVAVVYGILLYHAALPFTMTSWLLSNPQKSVALTVLAAFCFPWGIPMMFLLAGADSWFALGSRSPLAFVRARFLRLVLPMCAGIALLSPLQWYLSSVRTGRSLPGLIQSYPAFLRGVRLSWTPEWLGQYGYHLWFLGYLFAISTVLLPVLVLLRRPRSRRATAVAATFARRPGALYVFALPLVLSQVALRWRFPAYQDWADIATYTLVFLAGYVLASERSLEVAIRGGARLALTVGIVSAAGVGVMLVLAGGHPPGGPTWEVTHSVLWGLMIWSWLLVVLYVGIRWLDFANRVTAYLAESILPFYVLHHPVVLFVGSLVIALQAGVWPKFALVAAISTATTVALYELLVRRPAPMRFVFGLKPRPRERAGPTPPEFLPGPTGAATLPPPPRLEPDVATRLR